MISGRIGGVDSAGREGAAQLEQGAGLALAGAGDLRPGSLQGCQLSDDDPDEQEQDHAEKDAGIGDGERVERLGEQEVVEKERANGGHDRPDASRQRPP